MRQIDRRRIEAEMALRMYHSLAREVGAPKALEIIGSVASSDAFEQGRALAAKAPENKPCLAHFATVMDLWRAGGALEFKDVRLADDQWSFTVTRCGYAEMYRDMGLPSDLAYNLSCIRDGHLAAGYSDRLTLDRPQTIVRGHTVCNFIFTWK
jgi:hypothetical protein